MGIKTNERKFEELNYNNMVISKMITTRENMVWYTSLIEHAPDLNNPPTSLILICNQHTLNKPAFNANACLVIQQGNDNYISQLAFGFGDDKIAIRRKNGSATWTGWKYITLS